MGKFTGLITATIHGTGRGSDYFGSCEVCGKPCSEVFAHQNHRVYEREDGLRYLSPLAGGTYGHNDCLRDKYGDAVDKATLARAGNLTTAPA